MLLAGLTVSVVHAKNEHEIRIVSFRKATEQDSQIYYREIQNLLVASEVRRCRCKADKRAPTG